jgi:uncharacterized HAD superfamily protein
MLDIDDTLGDMASWFQNELRRRYKDESITFEDWTRDFGRSSSLPALTSEAIGDIIIEGNGLTDMKPREGLLELNAALQEKGYYVVLVTARGWHPEARKVTQEWMERIGFHYDELIVCPLDKCKEEATKMFKKVEIFMDDRFDHCLSMAESGRVVKSLVMDQPWNRNEYSLKVQRVRGIQDAIKHL